jgi:hypothetical protein
LCSNAASRKGSANRRTLAPLGRIAPTPFAQQGGLADSRLAAEDQHMTLTRARFHDESIQHLALAVTVEQPRP